MTLIELPSGAKVEMRGLTGKETKVLTDKDAFKNGTFLEKLLNGCTLGVADPGPYAGIQAGGAFDWANALQGDRFFAYMMVRVLTFGSEFIFKIQCQDSFCRERFEYKIDLLQDLPVKRLADEDKAIFASGQPFVTKDGSGREIQFRLPTGKDELVTAKAASFDSAFIQGLLQRIISIEGIATPRKYLEDAPFGDLLDLIDAFDEHNCGVKTDIEIWCPKCEAIQDIKVPFAQGFLATTRSKKAS